MLRSLYFLSFLLIAGSRGYAQNTQNYDSLKAKCEGPVFSLSEVMPDFKYGVRKFADSLKLYLQNNNAPPITGSAKFELTILRSGEIENVSLILTDIDDKNSIEIIEKALKGLSSQWLPGKQNGFLVCVYRRIGLNFSDKGILVTLFKH